MCCDAEHVTLPQRTRPCEQEAQRPEAAPIFALNIPDPGTPQLGCAPLCAKRNTSRSGKHVHTREGHVANPRRVQVCRAEAWWRSAQQTPNCIPQPLACRLVRHTMRPCSSSSSSSSSFLPACFQLHTRFGFSLMCSSLSRANVKHTYRRRRAASRVANGGSTDISLATCVNVVFLSFQ